MHAVESELLKATAYKSRTKFANRQDYLGAILNAVMKLTNEDFDNLTDDAAAWANAAVEARNSRSDDLPDFDEVPDVDASEDSPDEADDAESDETADEEAGDEVVEDGDFEDSTEDEDETEGEDETDPDDVEDAEEAEIKPVKKSAKKPPKPVKAAPKTGMQPHKMGRPKKSEEDIVLDKWGCMPGSKNAEALSMFEKGATAKEIKESLGGTYYNILKRQQMLGHLVEKEGSVIKLTHMDDLKAKAAKPAPKKGKK